MLAQEIITNSGTKLIVKPGALMQNRLLGLGAGWVGEGWGEGNRKMRNPSTPTPMIHVGEKTT